MAKHTLSALNSLTDRVSAKLSRYDNHHARGLHSEQGRLLSAISSINAIVDSPNSLETAAAHQFKISKAADKLKSEIPKIKERVYKSYTDYSMELYTKLSDRAGMVENQYASEIRTAFRSIPAADRLDYLSKVVADKDGATFAALVNAPEVVTGLAKDVRQAFTDKLYITVAPEIVDEINDLKEAMDGIEASLKAVSNDVNTYSDPNLLKQIEEQELKSQEAFSKFNASLS